MVSALLVIDKPAGITSHDVVARVRRLFGTKRVGHTGTLDPMATGVMVVCLGQATRLAEYLSGSAKQYVAEVVFGLQTDSQDTSGVVVAEQDASFLSRETVDRLLPAFRGDIEQVPPMVSALKHDGRRLYELARQGVTVTREARPVTIFALELEAFVPGERPVATLRVTCSSGTYIRTLAADLGAAAGTVAAMRALRRTWVECAGRRFALAAAVSLSELAERAAAETLMEVLLPLEAAVAGWPAVRLTEAEAQRLAHGQALRIEPDRVCHANADLPARVGPIAALSEGGILHAVARYRSGLLEPVKVLAAEGGAA